MTTITRETLELGALAAGYTITSFEPVGPKGSLVAILGVNAAGYGIHWRPHLGIADAARLAVRLRMSIEFECSDGPGDVTASALIGAEFCVRIDWHDGTNADAERAYCEAVTLCAAEIGRQMLEARVQQVPSGE